MPETKYGSGNQPSPGPAKAPGRAAVLVLVAVLAGYFLAGGGGWLWKNTSGVVHEFEVMRTYAKITIPGESGSAETPSDLARMAEEAVREVNDLMGPAGDRSDVRRLNDSPPNTWLEVHPLTWNVVMESLRWHRLSDGAFDPTIAPLKRLFSFEQARTDVWPDAGTLNEARQRVGADKILFEREGMRLAFREEGMSLDLGAIAKGYAADRAAETLLAHGVRNAVVDIGGELRVLGTRRDDSVSAPWRTGIRHPREDGTGDNIIERLEITDAAVATSGDYEKFFIHDGKRYEHIIDPRTGLPLSEGVASVTVIHPDSCLAADALATTLTVLGPEKGRQFLERQALGLFSRGVRIIMLVVEPRGNLRRIELNVDTRGNVSGNDAGITDEPDA